MAILLVLYCVPFFVIFLLLTFLGPWSFISCDFAGKGHSMFAVVLVGPALPQYYIPSYQYSLYSKVVRLRLVPFLSFAEMSTSLYVCVDVLWFPPLLSYPITLLEGVLPLSVVVLAGPVLPHTTSRLGRISSSKFIGFGSQLPLPSPFPFIGVSTSLFFLELLFCVIYDYPFLFSVLNINQSDKGSIFLYKQDL